MAFHLGCLRALNQAGLLDHVTVMSSVSGGSVIAALYCSHPGSFTDFEAEVQTTLARGFVRPAVVSALTSLEGAKAVVCFGFLAADRTAAWLFRLLLRPFPAFTRRTTWLRHSALRRWASRTTILRRTFDDLYRHRRLPELRADRPRLIIIACELRAKAAIYFTRDRVQCWRYGVAAPEAVSIGHAVAASAAYPALLPALDEEVGFTKNGVTRAVRVTLTDGGVYDNLGLAPFWPDRDPSISMEVEPFDRIIACRAGYALEVGDPATFVGSRMLAVFESIHARAQNLATSRLFDLLRAGRLQEFLLPYLGQDDARLAAAPPNLVRREQVSGYPTDFSAMPPEWIDLLSLRGETLVQALLAEHWPDYAPSLAAADPNQDAAPPETTGRSDEIGDI